MLMMPAVPRVRGLIILFQAVAFNSSISVLDDALIRLTTMVSDQTKDGNLIYRLQQRCTSPPRYQDDCCCKDQGFDQSLYTCKHSLLG